MSLGHCNSVSFIAFLFFFLSVSCDFSFSDDWNSALVARVFQVTAKPQEGETDRADTDLSSSLPPVIELYINVLCAGLLTVNSVHIPVPLVQN